jgi:hypothetical protein
VLSLRLKRGSIIKNYTYFTVCVVTTISLFFVTKVITVFVDYHKKLRLMISFFIKTSNENIILTGVTKNSKALKTQRLSHHCDNYFLEFTSHAVSLIDLSNFKGTYFFVKNISFENFTKFSQSSLNQAPICIKFIIEWVCFCFR